MWIYRYSKVVIKHFSLGTYTIFKLLRRNLFSFAYNFSIEKTKLNKNCLRYLIVVLCFSLCVPSRLGLENLQKVARSTFANFETVCLQPLRIRAVCALARSQIRFDICLTFNSMRFRRCANGGCEHDLRAFN